MCTLVHVKCRIKHSMATHSETIDSYDWFECKQWKAFNISLSSIFVWWCCWKGKCTTATTSKQIEDKNQKVCTALCFAFLLDRVGNGWPRYISNVIKQIFFAFPLFQFQCWLDCDYVHVLLFYLFIYLFYQPKWKKNTTSNFRGDTHVKRKRKSLDFGGLSVFIE